jgi:hypothetical protein
MYTQIVLNLRGGPLSPFILYVVVANVRRVAYAGFVSGFFQKKRARLVHASVFGKAGAPPSLRIDSLRRHT